MSQGCRVRFSSRPLNTSVLLSWWSLYMLSPIISTPVIVSTKTNKRLVLIDVPLPGPSVSFCPNKHEIHGQGKGWSEASAKASKYYARPFAQHTIGHVQERLAVTWPYQVCYELRRDVWAEIQHKDARGSNSTHVPRHGFMQFHPRCHPVNFLSLHPHSDVSKK